MTSQWRMARTGDRWVLKPDQPKAKDGFYWTDAVYWKASRARASWRGWHMDGLARGWAVV